MRIKGKSTRNSMLTYIMYNSTKSNDHPNQRKQAEIPHTHLKMATKEQERMFGTANSDQRGARYATYRILGFSYSE